MKKHFPSFKSVFLNLKKQDLKNTSGKTFKVVTAVLYLKQMLALKKEEFAK